MAAVAVVVLGVPRSGTTLVASVLHRLGVPMGETWTGRDDPSWQSWQPDGMMWTDAEFNDLHLRLTDGGPEVVHPELLDDYGRLIERRNRKGLWGVKCHLLPFAFREFCAKAEGVRLILTRRPPDESIRSYATRCSLSYTEAESELSRWRGPCTEAWEAFGGPRLEVEFADLVREPGRGVGRLADFVGLPSRASAVAMVDPTWKRF